MNNFTKESGRAYWHSITNLMCCSPGFRMLQNNSKKAAMLFMLFVMGAGATFAQTPVEGCMHEIPTSGSAQTAAIATASGFINTDGCVTNNQIHYIATQGDTFLVGDKPGVPGDYFPEGVSDQYSGFEKDSNHCNWVYYYVYDLKCNDDIKRITIKYTGGDHTAPVLKDKKNNPWPKDQKGLNLCYDDRPVAPSADAIAALFKDDCEHVKVTEMVTKRTRSKNDDCGWIEINTYTIGDYCNAFEMSITYSGSDQTDPWFVSTPADIVGNNAVYCDEIPPAQQLTWADNCARGGKVSAEIDQNEFDCSGGYILRTWNIVDNCGRTNSYTQKIEVRASKPVKFDETPLVVNVPCADREDFRDYFPDELRYSNSHDYINYPNPPTDEEDFHCQIEGYAKATYEIPDLSLSCSSFQVTYHYTDETEIYPGCTKITKVVTVNIVDTIMPTITKATDPLTVECDGSGNEAEFLAWLDNHGGATAQDNCDNDLTWTNDYEGGPLNGGCNDHTGSIFVTFTVKDDCGNQVKTGNVFRIVDRIAPKMTDVIPVRAVCDGEGNSSQYMNWLAEMGGTTASDDCDDKLELWHDGPVLAPKYEDENKVWHDAETLADYPDRFVGGCSEFTGVVTVTFYAKDDCGNTTSRTGTFSIEDSIAPVVTPASDVTLECDGTIPLFGLDAEDEDASQLHTSTNWYKYIMWLQTRGGATATDGCSDVKWTSETIYLNQHGGCEAIHTIKWTATDECGNASSTTATFKVQDTMTPVITQEALDFEVECRDADTDTEDEDGIRRTPLQTWLWSRGGASAYDKCDKHLTWTNDWNDRKLSDECGNTGAFTVTFTATDECGWSSTTSAEFRVVDNIAPYLQELPQVDLIAGDDCTADIHPNNTGFPQSNDACGDVNVTYSDASDKNDPKPDACIETITRTWKSTDECGNVTTKIQIITIADETAPELVGNANSLNKSNVDACEAPAGPSLAEVAALFHDNCYSPIVKLVNTTVFADDICGWSTSFEYTIEDRCGNMYKDGGFFKVIYFGKDQTKPVLDGTKPAGKDGLNMCYEDALAANPGVMDLVALAKEFKDNCDTDPLNVVKTFVDTRDFEKYGDDCIWSFHYNYKVYDRCGNYYEFNQEYSGEDKQAPRLNAGVDLNDLTQSNLTLCHDEAVQANLFPTTAEIALLFTECGLSPNGVIVNGKDGGDNTPISGNDIGGQDCGWLLHYEYTITDKCGNVAPESPLKVFMSGRDQEAPKWNVVGNDPFGGFEATFGTNHPSYPTPCPSDIEAYLSVGDVLNPAGYYNYIIQPIDGLDNSWVRINLGLAATDNCTANEDLRMVVTDVDLQLGTCETLLSYTFELLDTCGNSGGFVTCVFQFVDDTDPTASAPADMAVEGCLPEFDKALVLDAADNCNAVTVTDGGAVISDTDTDLNTVTWTQTYVVTDACGNFTTVSHDIVVEDKTAPQMTCPTNVDFGLVTETPAFVTSVAYTDCVNGNTSDYSDEDSHSHENNGNSVITVEITCDGSGFVTFTQNGTDGNGRATYSSDNSYYEMQYIGYWRIRYVGPGLDRTVAYVTSQGLVAPCGHWRELATFCNTIYSTCNEVSNEIVHFIKNRTFTATDDAGNTATCSVNYTWSIENDHSHSAAPDAPEAELNFVAYPVPFNSDVTLRYNFEFDTDVTVEVYDTKGLLVVSKKAAYKTGAYAEMPLRINGSDQLYYVKLITNQGTVTKKILASKL